MKTTLKVVGMASVVIFALTGIAAAKMTRMQAVEACVALAKKEDSGSSASLNTSDESKGRVQLYSACMKRNGFNP